MSVQAIAWVLENSESEGNTRLVFISIANHCDKYGRASYPSQRLLAMEARCSERTVRRSIYELRDTGELTWLEGGGRGRFRKSHLYWIPPMVKAAKVSAIPETVPLPDNVDPVTGQIRPIKPDTGGRRTVNRTVHIEPGNVFTLTANRMRNVTEERLAKEQQQREAGVE